MKRHHRLLLSVILSLVFPVSLHAQEAKAQAKPAAKPAAKTTAKPAAKKIAVLRAAGDMKWTDVPNASGVQQATLWGNPEKGAHGVLNKFQAGTEVPLHTHTADLRSVVLSGTVVIGIEGQSPKELGPGSYLFLPGGLKHTTACKTGEDCLLFTTQPGAFDVKPAEAAGAKK